MKGNLHGVSVCGQGVVLLAFFILFDLKGSIHTFTFLCQLLYSS